MFGINTAKVLAADISIGLGYDFLGYGCKFLGCGFFTHRPARAQDQHL
jgi:hypothetical protein